MGPSLIFAKPLPVLTCHCTVGVGEPLAAAVKLVVPPALTVAAAGFVVTTGRFWLPSRTVIVEVAA